MLNVHDVPYTSLPTVWVSVREGQVFIQVNDISAASKAMVMRIVAEAVESMEVFGFATNTLLFEQSVRNFTAAVDFAKGGRSFREHATREFRQAAQREVCVRSVRYPEARVTHQVQVI